MSNQLNIIIIGKSEYDFDDFDFKLFKFVLDRDKTVYYHDNHIDVKTDEDRKVTITLSDVPIQMEGKKVTLTDIEMDMEYSDRVIYPMLRIDKIETNLESVEIDVKLDEEHDQYIVFQDEEPIYDDPDEICILDHRYPAICVVDLRFCGFCTHFRNEEYLSHIKYICFNTNGVEYRVPVQGRCTVPDYIQEEREDYPRAIAFDIVFSVDPDVFVYGESTICDIIFDETTPSNLEIDIGDVLDDDAANVDIKYNRRHDPHITYMKAQ